MLVELAGHLDPYRLGRAVDHRVRSPTPTPPRSNKPAATSGGGCGWPRPLRAWSPWMGSWRLRPGRSCCRPWSRWPVRRLPARPGPGANAPPMPWVNWPAAVWRAASCPRSVGSARSWRWSWTPRASWAAGGGGWGGRLGGRTAGPGGPVGGWPVTAPSPGCWSATRPATTLAAASLTVTTTSAPPQHRRAAAISAATMVCDLDLGLAGWLGPVMARLPAILGGAPTQPLNLGRSTRVISPGQRTALAVRDGGCAVPACARPWPGAKATTWSPGWTGARPTCPTWCCCVGLIIGPSMRAAGASPATPTAASLPSRRIGELGELPATTDDNPPWSDPPA